MTSNFRFTYLKIKIKINVFKVQVVYSFYFTLSVKIINRTFKTSIKILDEFLTK